MRLALTVHPATFQHIKVQNFLIQLKEVVATSAFAGISLIFLFDLFIAGFTHTLLERVHPIKLYLAAKNQPTDACKRPKLGLMPPRQG